MRELDRVHSRYLHFQLIFVARTVKNDGHQLPRAAGSSTAPATGGGGGGGAGAGDELSGGSGRRAVLFRLALRATWSTALSIRSFIIPTCRLLNTGGGDDVRRTVAARAYQTCLIQDHTGFARSLIRIAKDQSPLSGGGKHENFLMACGILHTSSDQVVYSGVVI